MKGVGGWEARFRREKSALEGEMEGTGPSRGYNRNLMHGLWVRSLKYPFSSFDASTTHTNATNSIRNGQTGALRTRKNEPFLTGATILIARTHGAFVYLLDREWFRCITPRFSRAPAMHKVAGYLQDTPASIRQPTYQSYWTKGRSFGEAVMGVQVIHDDPNSCRSSPLFL